MSFISLVIGLSLGPAKAGTLSDDEQAELDRFGELEHLMQLVKARARRLTT